MYGFDAHYGRHFEYWKCFEELYTRRLDVWNCLGSLTKGNRYVEIHLPLYIFAELN